MKLESLLKKYSKIVDKIVNGDVAAEQKAADIEPEIDALIKSAKDGYGADFVVPYEQQYKDLRNLIYF